MDVRNTLPCINYIFSISIQDREWTFVVIRKIFIKSKTSTLIPIIKQLQNPYSVILH